MILRLSLEKALELDILNSLRNTDIYAMTSAVSEIAGRNTFRGDFSLLNLPFSGSYLSLTGLSFTSTAFASEYFVFYFK